jgi:hypothetical protein
MSSRNILRQLTAAFMDDARWFIGKKVTALAANATLNNTHFGGLITNRGASGAITLTLPDASAAFRGAWFEYFGVADQTITFTATTVDTLVSFNDAAVDSVAFSTSGEKIGARADFVCDGTSWIVSQVRGTLTASS